MSKERFRVIARLDNGYLFLQFPGNPDIFTQARYLGEIEIMAIDAIHLMRDIPKELIELEIEATYPANFPKSFIAFLLNETINKVRNLIHLRELHRAPSADGKYLSN